jgi:hypothetical protein
VQATFGVVQIATRFASCQMVTGMALRGEAQTLQAFLLSLTR